jgi:hypothetical protein
MTNIVSIEFVLDETGSMNRCKNATIGGFNEYLSEQRDQSGLCQMTLTKFEGGNLVTPYEDLDLGFVPEMTTSTFLPAGGTNLFDAIIARVQARRAAIKDWTVEPNILLVVMTDGGDNISRNTVAEVRSLIDQVQLDGWTCVYLGADQNALAVGSAMGFRPGNIKSFASAEMQETMRGLSAATTVYRTAAATGTATKNFF